tara:strand:- start:4831 stop:6282 length:1452 start_codon:yes stop_codon:yes gene_type:complete
METHQEKILALQSGWNPINDNKFEKFDLITEPMLSVSDVVKNGGAVNVSYIFSAIIAKLTGNIENGKAINFIYFFIFGLISTKTIFTFFKGYIAFLILIALLINPILITQLYSFYLDGHVYSLYGSILLLYSMILFKKEYCHIFLIFILSILLIGTKKKGIGLIGITLPLVFLTIILKSQQKGRLLILSSFISVVTLIVGIYGAKKLGFWDSTNGHFPYTPTNIIKLLDPTTMDYWLGTEIPGSNKPYPMKDMGRIEQFVRSNFSETNILREDLQWKNPFRVSKNELSFFYSTAVDIRLGGFGPLFGGVLIISFILLFLNLFTYKKSNTSLFLYIFIIILPCFFLPTWWARWISFIWFVPILITSYPFMHSNITKKFLIVDFSYKGESKILLNLFCLILLIFNGCVVAYCNICGHINENSKINADLKKIKSWNQPVEIFSKNFKSNRLWFYSNDIEFIFHKEKPLKEADLILHRTGTLVYKTL